MSSAQGHIKIKLREINRHLVCRLCRGYYVDATTIAECLHSFCRSCIIKYLEKNSFCPICEVQIHKTKPYLNLRLDKALQDVVYKVVPGLYHDEMKRRREFYTKCREQIPFATPEQCGLEERIIFSPEDSISLSLEYLESDDYESETVSSRSSESGDAPDVLTFPQQLGLIKLKNNEGKGSRRESQDLQDPSPFPKRYLQCPAVVNIGHLKKFIRMKHDLTDKMQVNIVHKRVPLPDYYTLMDVAYIYTWKRSAPLRFFYQIYRTRKHKLTIPPLVHETKKSKLETIAEDQKPIKVDGGDENRNINAVSPPPPESDNSAKSNADKTSSPIAEVKQTVQNNVLKNVDSNKPVPESGSVKSEASVNSKPGVQGVTDVKKEVLQSDGDKCAVPRSGKNEKSKPVNGVSASESKSKLVENQKNANEKMENNASVREVKENDSNSERLLLNPISGQLESVPLNDSVQPVVNGSISVASAKDAVECFKRDIGNKGQKKTESQCAKDAKKSNVNLLKSFRKEKLSSGKEEKTEMKSTKGSSLTITAVSKTEKPPEKQAAKFSVEIKAENKESEYDFDGSSPPGKIIPLQEFSKYSKYSKYMADHRDKWLSKESKNSWMSLQDFREKMLKENNSAETDLFKKNKKKLVPSLYKINSDKNKTSIRKTPNGKLSSDKWKGSKIPRTVINIQTETEDKKTEFKVEVIGDKTGSPPTPTKVEPKDTPKEESDTSSGKSDNGESKSDPVKQVEHEKKGSSSVKESSKDDSSQEKRGGESPKDNGERRKSESLGAIDLSRGETSQKSEGSSEGLADMANRTRTPKGDEKMVEALISAAQKQSAEPLLKVPHYSQAMKSSPGSYSPVKNISPSEISQALQFLEDLRSDIKVLESKNQLNPNSVLEQFAQKSGNIQPYQELYQQKIDLIRRLKRHQQIMPNDSESLPRKLMKLSPTSESKKLSPPSEKKPKTSVPDEASQFKASIDKTLSQIQLMELENRMLVAQNYKNLPALLQYYNRPPAFCPGPTSPNKSSQPKAKAPSHSPNSSKSPQSRTSPSANPALGPGADHSLFTSPSYLINAGLNSEMTYLQMFQSYLSQQEQMNQVKLSQIPKKPVKFSEVSAKSLTDKYYVPQPTAKKQESANSAAPAQKT